MVSSQGSRQISAPSLHRAMQGIISCVPGRLRCSVAMPGLVAWYLGFVLEAAHKAFMPRKERDYLEVITRMGSSCLRGDSC